jgi:DNA polymerase III delta prime subunit
MKWRTLFKGYRNKEKCRSKFIKQTDNFNNCNNYYEEIEQKNNNGDNYNNLNIGNDYKKTNLNKSVYTEVNNGIVNQSNLYIENFYTMFCRDKLLNVGDNFEYLERKYIVGRDKELNNIKSFLNKYKGINIWGVAGIGKTTIAKILYKELQNYFDHIIVLVLTNPSKTSVISLKEKLIEEFEKFSDDESIKSSLRKLSDINQKYKKVIKILNNPKFFGGKKLIIIDNIISFKRRSKGQVDIEELRELFSLNNTLFILTSRQKLGNFTYILDYYLKPLSLENSLKLFKVYYRYKLHEEGKVKNLIMTVQKNTFFIEILAKTVATGDISLDKLSKKLKNLELPNIEVYIEGENLKLRKFYEELLNLSWQCLNDTLRILMKRLSLLTANISIEIEFLNNYLNESYIKGKIWELINRGFLEWEEEGKSIIMHQMIKDYLLYIKKPTYVEIKEQINFILNSYLENLNNSQKIIGQDKLIEIIEGIGDSLLTLNIRKENIGKLFNQLGCIYDYLGKYDKAEEYFKKSLNIYKRPYHYAV